MTRHLLDRFAIRTPLLSCHKFNEAARGALLEERIAAGQAVALVTDSGMPGVSDPGARMVRACRAAGRPVWIVPGPSAVACAAALCGADGAEFHFGGFLPHKSGGRQRALEGWRDAEWPVILYESPYRLLKLLDEIERILPGRRLFVGRELTKLHEEQLVGAPAEIRARFAGRNVKGELVVAILPADERPDKRSRIEQPIVGRQRDGAIADGDGPRRGGMEIDPAFGVGRGETQIEPPGAPRFAE